jgi:hypothetical protein
MGNNKWPSQEGRDSSFQDMGYTIRLHNGGLLASTFARRCSRALTMLSNKTLCASVQ